MRLKEIKPGMVIHCKTKEEMEELAKHIKFLTSVDNIWYYGNDGVRRDCIRINDMGQYDGFCTYDYFANEEGCKITEFSDLILPELTAEEVLEICGELCKEYSYKGCACSSKCPFAHHDDMSCTFYRSQNPDKAIEVLEQWKAEHEKKEPEIETVDICRIIEVLPDGTKRCVHEEEIKPELPFDADKDVAKILKHYCMEHDGEFIAVHKVVSRVKKVK